MPMSVSPAARDGRDARSPWQVPAEGWKQILLRTWRETGDDNIGLVAAGVAFYGFLALVPLLGAITLTYGLLADPQTVVEHMRSLMTVMPADAARLVGEQLMNVVQTSGEAKGIGVVVALAIALFGARNGAGAIIMALNIAYEEKEKRGFALLNLLAIAITAAAVVVAIVAVLAIAALGHLEALFPGAPGFLLTLGKAGSYLLLTLAGAAGAATLYRYGPSREHARWEWLTPGSVLAGLLWLVLTLGFGFYVANFGDYDATYGSLGGVMVLLTWMYLSSYILLVGAELNAELEHQTAQDTTNGAERRLGARGAWVADHVARGAGDGRDRPGEAIAGTGRGRPGDDAARPSAIGSYAAARVTARAGRAAGMPRVGMVPAVLSTAGLALFRRQGGATGGAILMITASGLAWLTRERGEPDGAGDTG